MVMESLIIYINHDLTAYKRILLAKAKEVKKRLGYRFLWIVDGDIFVRKMDGAKKFRIRCEEDLFKM